MSNQQTTHCIPSKNMYDWMDSLERPEAVFSIGERVVLVELVVPVKWDM